MEAESSDVLDQTEWVLKSINGEELVEGSEITAVFAEGNISGTSGCNRYGSSYEVSGTSLIFSIFISTRMACEESLMNQEMVYLTAMEKVVSFTLDEGRLVIQTDEANELVFVLP
jgi:heat shock protein HslJ